MRDVVAQLGVDPRLIDGVHILAVAILDSSDRVQHHASTHLEVRFDRPSRHRRQFLGCCTALSGSGGTVFADLGSWASASRFRCDLPRAETELALLGGAGPSNNRMNLTKPAQALELRRLS